MHPAQRKKEGKSDVKLFMRHYTSKQSLPDAASDVVFLNNDDGKLWVNFGGEGGGPKILDIVNGKNGQGLSKNSPIRAMAEEVPGLAFDPFVGQVRIKQNLEHAVETHQVNKNGGVEGVVELRDADHPGMIHEVRGALYRIADPKDINGNGKIVFALEGDLIDEMQAGQAADLRGIIDRQTAMALIPGKVAEYGGVMSAVAKMEPEGYIAAKMPFDLPNGQQGYKTGILFNHFNELKIKFYKDHETINCSTDYDENNIRLAKNSRGQWINNYGEIGHAPAYTQQESYQVENCKLINQVITGFNGYEQAQMGHIVKKAGRYVLVEFHDSLFGTTERRLIDLTKQHDLAAGTAGIKVSSETVLEFDEKNYDRAGGFIGVTHWSLNRDGDLVKLLMPLSKTDGDLRYGDSTKRNRSLGAILAGLLCFGIQRRLDRQPTRIFTDKTTGKESVFKTKHLFFFVPLKWWGYLLGLLGIAGLVVDVIIKHN